MTLVTRTADSESTSDCTVSLPSPLLMNGDHGIQLKSLYIPNTLKAVNYALNNKLYTSLDEGTSTVYHTHELPSANYDNAAMLAADLEGIFDTVYSSSVLTVQNAAGEWRLNNATPFDFVGSGLVYTYGSRTLTFSLTTTDQIQVFTNLREEIRC